MSEPFDPDAPAAPGSGLFGLDLGPDEARVHVIPVPFDATASFRGGAARAPAAILRASHQVELHDPTTGRPFEAGIWMAPIAREIERWNEAATACAARVRERRAELETDAALRADRDAVNGIGEELNAFVHDRVSEALERGKLVATLGGDHSTPFGAIRAHAERHPGLGILHVDAHADLREAYEGFEWSHASILHNVTARLDGIGTVVQVGLRDVCGEEVERIRGSGGRIRALFDHEWAHVRLTGGDLPDLVRRTLDPLPREVYVTFDVDGFDPALCPGTGTPVPGGLSWHEAMLLLSELVASGRRIVGLDLTEVAPSPGRKPGEGWDAIVGARLLYRLIGHALRSGAAGARNSGNPPSSRA